LRGVHLLEYVLVQDFHQRADAHGLLQAPILQLCPYIPKRAAEILGIGDLVYTLVGGRRLSCGSSLKFCRIAEGSVGLSARLAQTCEWDVAAGHAILAAAGGSSQRPSRVGVWSRQRLRHFRFHCLGRSKSRGAGR
jgi:hypothetical protein